MDNEIAMSGEGNLVVPTVSGTVSNSSSSGSISNETGVNNSPFLSSSLDILQQKYKDNESVLAIFEAYQIVNHQHCSRLLALVVSVKGGTYAIFSWSAACLPLRSCGDLTIHKIFPLNDRFQFVTDSKGSISQLQFQLKNFDESATQYYYYPSISAIGASDFYTFHAQVHSAKMSMAYPTTATDSVLSFTWLNNYRQIGEVKQELKRREEEYIVYKELNVYCASWNVNNKPYCDSPLNLWLAACDEPPDIYAIALQELDTSAMAITLSQRSPDALWINKMVESVHKDTEYEELTSVRLVGMMLTIIVKKNIRKYVTRCRVKSIACGVLNTLGNKGGVAVSIQFNEGNICFVNSHLAAHLASIEARNEDYARIAKGIVFDDNRRRTINDHEHIFWLGDLNYRIEEPPGMTLPFYQTDLNAYEVLLQFDQLQQEKRKGNCFNGYSEGPIKFRPTYKYDVGTDNYDSSEKQRPPAYCDRIMWKGVRIEQVAYNSVMKVQQSDHKPIYARFIVKIKTKDEVLYKRVHEEVLKLVDKRENENQPQITVEKTVIDFGLVHFNEMVVSDFTVFNNCPMPVDFMFKKKDPPLSDICEKWLRVEPRAENLMTDMARSIRVNLLANARSITGLLKKIQTTSWKFDFDILILHVINGPDVFITVTGEYKPSCFGLSMETLCRTDRPLNDYTQAELKDLLNDESPEFRVTMPREFFLLIDYLHKQDNRVEGAFASLEYKHTRGVQFNEVRDWLDSWSKNDFPSTPYAAAETLIMLLDLPEKPLLHPFVEKLVATNTTSEAMDLVTLLSSPRRNVFVHLCMFLREGIVRKYYNAHQVATTFGRILLRSGSAYERSVSSAGTNNYSKDSYRDQRCRDFMHRFICSDVSTLSDATSSSLSPGSGHSS